jgi:TolB-like protein
MSGWFGLIELPSEKSVAVLPFHVVGDDPASQAFADGLIETITSKLSELEQFQQTLIVVPASDVRERGVTSVNTAQATFGVTLAISGSVQRRKPRPADAQPDDAKTYDKSVFGG